MIFQRLNVLLGNFNMESIALVPSKPKNKVGNPAWVKGVLQRAPKMMEDPGVRMKFLAKEHGIAVILACMKDEKLLAKTFSTYDGMLIMGFANSLKGSDTARESMLNRMFGKVPDKQINLNLNIDVDPENLSSRAGDMLSSLVSGDDDLIEE